MKMRKDKKDVAFYTVCIVLLAVSLVGILFPLYWLLLTSLKDTAAAYKTPPELTITLKDEYNLTVDSSSYPEYDYDTFKKESVMMVWMIYDTCKTENIGNLRISWVVNGVIKATTSYSEIDYKRTRNQIFAATRLTPLLISVPINYAVCVEEMERCNAFKTDLNQKFDLKATDSKNEDLLRDYVNTLQIADRNGENARYYFTFENVVSTVTAKKYYKGIFSNYRFAFNYFQKEHVTFFRFMWNSFKIAAMAILFQFVLTAPAAFAVAKIISTKLANIITIFFIATMMIPSIVYIIPLYSMVAKYNLVDKWLMVVLPGIPNATAFVLFKGFFQGIPREMYEAGKIDGANEGQLLLRIYVPMSASVFGVIALLTFTGNWSDLMWPSMILKNTVAQTFPIIINRMLGAVESGGVDYSMALAMSAMAMAPTLIVFLIFQKQLSKGLVFEGIKG